MSRLVAIFGVLTLASYQWLKLIHRFIRKKLVAEQTGLLELSLLGVPRKDGRKIDGTAVICGGSIAGLLAARVCHDHFERVIVIEAEGWLSTEEAWPDDISALPKKRTRLLQWDTYQLIQVWGSSCLSKLFPSFDSECALSRIPIVPADWKVFVSGSEIRPPFDKYNGNLPPVVSVGRPGLETLLRRLVVGRKQYPGIEQIYGTVTGYEKDPLDPKRLSTVLVRRGSDNKVISIPSALIIDCTGPSRAGSKIIRRLGFGTPEGKKPSLFSFDSLTVQYEHEMHYSSFAIAVTDDMIKQLPEQARKDGPIGFYLPDWTKGRRIVLSQKIDRNIFQILAGGWGESELPNDLKELEAFARSLEFETPIPEWWYDFIRTLTKCESRVSVKRARVPASVYTPFHRVINMPNNWVALGDSIMNINPIFAQGINKALLGIVSLNSLLHQTTSDRLSQSFSEKFFDIQAKKIEPLWQAVKSIDYNFDTTTPVAGETLSNGWFMRLYIRSTMKLATRDAQAGSAVWHVMNFLAPPIDYFHPYLVPQVLLEMIKSRLGF